MSTSWFLLFRDAGSINCCFIGINHISKRIVQSNNDNPMQMLPPSPISPQTKTLDGPNLKIKEVLDATLLFPGFASSHVGLDWLERTQLRG